MINMEIFGPILISTIAGFSTFLGGLVTLIKLKKEAISSFISFSLALSIGVMIMLSVIELIPNPSYQIIRYYGFKGVIYSFIAGILGYLLVKVSNRLLKTKQSNLYRVGVLSMIALMLHNFPEGIATFMASYQDINLGISLGIAIMMHNIPEGISIAVPIYYSTGKRGKALVQTLISGLAEPLGAILTYLLLRKYITTNLINLILIFIAGIMITLAINELLPEALKYKKNKAIIGGLITGVIITILSHVIF